MNFAKIGLAIALVTGLSSCSIWNKSVAKVDLDDEVKYSKRMCASDAMVGNKRGLEIAPLLKSEWVTL